MIKCPAFNWHEDAKLFAGTTEIVRPNPNITAQFQSIPARPTFDAACALGSAIVNTCGFCISETPVPSNTQVAPGHFLTLTGGSSGRPKLIQRTQASWIASFIINARIFSLTTTDAVAVFGDLGHSLALYGLLEALHIGANAHLFVGLKPNSQRNVIAEKGITILYATPTQLRLMTQHTLQSTLPDVRLILCGGGILDQKTKSAAQTLCPNAAVHVFYGASETSFITLTDSATPEGSVGCAYPGVTLQIRDANNKPTQGIGEVWVQSPYTFERYMSEECTDTQQHDGFVTVGEMGQLDATGNLWLKGRKTRMVTIADQNVFPEAIEALITSHFAVRACAVLPVPDQTRGHRLIAILEGPQEERIAQSVKETCRAELGRLMTPQKVLFHPSLPLLSSGKVDLTALSEWVEEQQ